MKPFFKELFEYNHYTNQKLAELFVANHEKVSEKSVKLFSHILNAHHIWNSRISQTPSSYKVWDLQPLASFSDIDKVNYKSSLQILETFELDMAIHYSTSAGQAFINTVRDILFHTNNHASYHKGQIASEFKNAGIEPLVNDYIFYKRQDPI